MDGLVQHAHCVVPNMLCDVTCVIHHIEVHVLGEMGIVAHRLVHQGAIDEAGSSVDHRECKVVHCQGPVRGNVHGRDGQVVRAVDKNN